MSRVALTPAYYTPLRGSSERTRAGGSPPPTSHLPALPPPSSPERFPRGRNELHLTPLTPSLSPVACHFCWDPSLDPMLSSSLLCFQPLSRLSPVGGPRADVLRPVASLPLPPWVPALSSSCRHILSSLHSELLSSLLISVPASLQVLVLSPAP